MRIYRAFTQTSIPASPCTPADISTAWYQASLPEAVSTRPPGKRSKQAGSRRTATLHLRPPPPPSTSQDECTRASNEDLQPHVSLPRAEVAVVHGSSPQTPTESTSIRDQDSSSQHRHAQALFNPCCPSPSLFALSCMARARKSPAIVLIAQSFGCAVSLLWPVGPWRCSE